MQEVTVKPEEGQRVKMERELAEERKGGIRVHSEDKVKDKCRTFLHTN
jgi:hypothetical protein